MAARVSPAVVCVLGLALLVPLVTAGCVSFANERERYYEMFPPAESAIAGTWTRVGNGVGNPISDFWTTTDKGIVRMVGADVFLWTFETPNPTKVWDRVIGDGYPVAVAGVGADVFVFYMDWGGLSDIVRLNLDTLNPRSDPVPSNDDRSSFVSFGDTRTIVVDDIIYLVGGICGVCGNESHIWSYDPRTYELRYEASIPLPENEKFIIPRLRWGGDSILIASYLDEPFTTDADQSTPEGRRQASREADEHMLNSSFMRIWGLDPRSGSLRVVEPFIRPGPGPVLLLDSGEMWGLGGCAKTFDPVREGFYGVGGGPPWDYANKTDSPFAWIDVTGTSVMDWNGKHYLHMREMRKGGHTTYGLWTWEPPSPSWVPEKDFKGRDLCPREDGTKQSE